MKVTASKSGHSPKVTANFSYDTSTQKAAVTWTVGSGSFKYKFFRFYIRMGRQVSGEWKYTDTLIGGMSGSGGTNIWKDGSASKTVSIGSNTRCCFCFYCSAKNDGGSCDSGWGDGVTKVTDYYNIKVETTKATLTLKSGTTWTDPVTKVNEAYISKYPDKITVHWATSGNAPKKLACNLTRISNSTVVATPYSTSSPLSLNGSTKSGDIEMKVPANGVNYTCKLAISSEETGETIANQWSSDYSTQNFRSRDGDPTVYFENAVTSGSSVTFQYRSIYTTDNSYIPLATLKYKLTDTTTGTSTTNYIFQNRSSSQNGTDSYKGSYTITGITLGHQYTVEPVADTCSLYNHVAMAKGYSASFMSVSAPTVGAITNDGNDLIHGRPEGAPAVNVVINGTANVWNITLKIGTGISNGIVTTESMVGTLSSAVVGTNKINLSASALTKLEQAANGAPSIRLYASIEYSLKSTGGDAGTHYSSNTMIFIKTTAPVINLQAGTIWTDPVTGITDQTISTYSNKICIRWSTSGNAPKKLACTLTDTSTGAAVSAPYSIDSPLILDGTTKYGSIEFPNLYPTRYYECKLAISSEDSGETIAEQWNDDYVTKKFRTRDEEPIIYFENAVCSGTSVTFQYRSVSATGNSVRLATLKYRLTDVTSGSVTTGYILQNNTSSGADSFKGTYTIYSLTPGHTYGIEPIDETCSLNNHVSMIQGNGTQFLCPLAPGITKIANSGDDLIYGKPDGNPCINVTLSGTTDSWNITLKLGTSVYNGIVQNPFAIVSSAVIGVNTVPLTSSMLSTLKAAMNSSNYTPIYASIEYIATRGTDSGSSYSYKSMSFIKTSAPSLSLQSDTRWLDPYTSEVEDYISMYADKIYVHWETSGTAPKKMQGGLITPNGNLYTTEALVLDGNSKSGNIKLDAPVGGGGTWYQIKFAISSEESGETIEDQWSNNYILESFRTRDNDPYVYFTDGSCSGTTATFSYRAVDNYGNYIPMATIAYRLEDQTDGTSTTGYIFQGRDGSDGSSSSYVGTYTLLGLMPGHTYNVIPNTGSCSLYNHVPMAQGYSTSFMGAVTPEITNITNSGGNLIFGEPDGNPYVNVEITGSASVWSITLKIGTSISGGIVQNPVVTRSVDVGSNIISLTDDMLDAIYKSMNIDSTTTLYASIEYYITSSGGNNGSSYSYNTMVLKGNAKTSKVGVAGKPRRAKAWVGVAGTRRRAVIWGGVAGKRRRVL